MHANTNRCSLPPPYTKGSILYMIFFPLLFPLLIHHSISVVHSFLEPHNIPRYSYTILIYSLPYRMNTQLLPILCHFKQSYNELLCHFPQVEVYLGFPRSSKNMRIHNFDKYCQSAFCSSCTNLHFYQKCVNEGCLVRSVGRACDSWSWSCELKPQVGCRDCLNK